MTRIKSLISLYSLYRNGGHTRLYAARRAWHIVIQGADF